MICMTELMISDPDDVSELGGKAGVARALEGAQPVRLQLVRPPDALYRTQRNADGVGHRPAGPLGRLVRRLGAEPAPAKAGVSATTCALVSAAIGGLPGFRVLSRSRPSTPLSAKRCCHRHTVGRLTPMLWATRCTECRSPEASTMRARSTCLRDRLRSAAIAANCSSSAALKTTHLLCHGPHPPIF
jgi:hypothetical protein